MSDETLLKRLSAKELADHWEVTNACLVRWRWEGKGPYYLKIGRNVWYPVRDIRQYEESQLRRHTGERR